MILIYPDPFLTKVVPESTSVNVDNVFKMLEVVKQLNAQGLAANQIGINEKGINNEFYT